MKYILILILFAVSNSVWSQDFCKKVKKESSDEKTFTYTTPMDTAGITPIKASRTFSIDAENAFSNFTVEFKIVSDLATFFAKNPNGDGANDLKKFSVEFEDKTFYVEDEIFIGYEMLNENQLVVRSVTITLDEKNIKDFSTKKISKFSFGGVSKEIAPEYGTAILAYVQCIKNFKN